MARFVNNNTNELLTPDIQNTQTSPFAQSLVSDIVPPSRLGGGVVRGDLQSENYVSGITGWKLRRDGVIEALSIQIAGSSTIAGWNIDSTTIYQTGAVLSSTGYVAFGATPPTTYGNNVGAWLGFTGGKAKFSLYNNSSNYFQWDGDKLLIKAANFTLDSSGNITATNANITGAITATSGTFTGTVNASAGTFTGTVDVNGTLRSSSSGARWNLDTTPNLKFFDSTRERMRLSSDKVEFWDNTGASAGNIKGGNESGVPSVSVSGVFYAPSAFIGLGMTVGGALILETDVPASSSASGVPGQIAVDGNYIYVCVATDTWRQAEIFPY